MFCPKCGSILMPKKKEGKTIIKCTCGYEDKSGASGKMSQKNTTIEKEVEVVDSNFTTLAETNEDCPKCGNTTAHYFLQQTRSADESPTKFLKCTKCKHTWRDYS